MHLRNLAVAAAMALSVLGAPAAQAQSAPSIAVSDTADLGPILTDQDAVSGSAGFGLFAACSCSLKCSIAAVRLLRRWWNRMSESSLPARRRSASRIISCSRIASPQRSRLRAKLAE